MTKKVFMLMLALFATTATTMAQISINAANFPDPNFRNYLLEQWYGRDGKLTDAEIAAVVEIEVGNREITNLKGIEHFTALVELYCWDNQITALDVSKNTKLTGLFCSDNLLTSINVSNNTALRRLNVIRNQIGTIDISKNTELTLLACDNNRLTTLNTSKNTKLDELHCSGNQLTALDLSGNPLITEVWCQNNSLTAINTSGNKDLTVINCSDNLLNSLDLSKITELTVLACDNNRLTTLNLSKNTIMERLECYGNQIKGEGMQALVESLPTMTEKAEFIVINLQNTDEQNEITKEQVKIAKDKGWKVCDFERTEYEGIDQTGIHSIENSQLKIGNWYTIDGKKWRGEPARKGIYIVSGRKTAK